MIRRLVRRRPDLPEAVSAKLEWRPRDVLAFACTVEGEWLVAGRRALAIVGPAEVSVTGWEDIEHAGWSRDDDLLLVEWVSERRRTFRIEEPGRLLSVLRERVSSTVVLERRVPEARGMVVCRRVPETGELVWRVRYGRGADPADPDVAAAVERALIAAQDELGPR